MKRSNRWLVGIVGIQVVLVGVYWLVECRRESDGAEGHRLGTEPPQRVRLSMSRLSIRQPDGNLKQLGIRRRPTLVHFWATWCPPCRKELPGFLELPNKHGIDALAVALDGDWTDIEEFLDGIPTSNVVLGKAAEIEKILGGQRLPVTFWVQPNGQASLRFDGARNWRDVAFLQRWIANANGGLLNTR